MGDIQDKILAKVAYDSFCDSILGGETSRKAKDVAFLFLPERLQAAWIESARAVRAEVLKGGFDEKK
jgi:hypothetical protein